MRRRIKLLKLILSRIKGLLYLIAKEGFKSAYNYLWVHAFTRDSGLALLDPLYRRFPSLVTYPQTIEVEITTRCHLKCTMCEHTYWDESPHDMSLAEFKKIIDQFPKLKWLGMTGIGSNFLNKDFLSMLRYVKSKKVYVEFFDTFDLITEKNAEELIKIGVNKIWLSIDAARPETYEKIRVGTKFEKVTRNLKNLMELKKRYKTPFPEIWFHYIITSDNASELPEFVELVHDLTSNGSNLATMIYFTNLLCFNEVKGLLTTLSDEVIKETEILGKKYGIYISWNQNIKPIKPISFCTRWTEPFILATGHVQSCCAINEANTRRYQKEKSFGNLLETEFKYLWNNKHKKFRMQIHNNELPEICKYCRNFIR